MITGIICSTRRMMKLIKAWTPSVEMGADAITSATCTDAPTQTGGAAVAQLRAATAPPLCRWT